MSTISFYQVTGDVPAALDGVLPPLLEKMLKSGVQALVVAPTEARCTRLDETLWTYAESSFLPHATLSDAHPENHPVLLAYADETHNPLAQVAGRTPLVLAGAEGTLEGLLAQPTPPEKILYMFTASQPDVARARPLFKGLKEKGHSLQYWQQTEKGWQNKA